MAEVLRFALLGLATGGVYALLAQGVVLTYRGSGILNFAQGAFAMFGAYAYYQLSVKEGWSLTTAAITAVALCALLGAAFHLFALKPMRKAHASSLSRVIATLSVLLILQSLAQLVYGTYPLTVPSLLPTETVHVFSPDLPITVDRLWILGICLTLSGVLYVVYKWTSFGRVTAAVAESEVSAATMGHSPDLVAAINWAVGSALAGLAGILIAPIVFLEPSTLVLLVIPAMAVALVGRFSSFPVVLAAALVLGVTQSEMSRYVPQQGWSTAVPFVIVIVLLVFSGQSLPLRSFVLDRMPAVGSGKPRPVIVVLALAAAWWVTSSVEPSWNVAMVTTFGMAIICMSIVFLTGYAGQLSLAQYVVAGVGALATARLSEHISFMPALAISAVLTAAVGAAIGLPALRTRGVTLAVVTLCMASGIVSVVFANADLTGGITGIFVPSPTILGWSIDPFLYTGRYAFVTFALLIAIAVAMGNVRRGVVGRQMLAVRANERAAASLGVPVASVKVYSFFVAAAIAAVGGSMLVFAQPTVQMTQFDVFTCILLVGVTVTAGVGYLPGGILGGTLIAGGVMTMALNGWDDFDTYLPLLGAILLLVTMVTAPDGSAPLVHRLALPILERTSRVGVRIRTLTGRSYRPWSPASNAEFRVTPRTLRVEHLSVSFGGVKAVEDVTLSVSPGEVHGLIGPNGAGKTTVIDAVTGFVKAHSGSIELEGMLLTRWSARRRAVGGISRSFQSLELFDDLTVAENLSIASSRQEWWRYLTDPIWPGRIALNAPARAAVESFALADVLDKRPDALSFGQRKLVAIARCLASEPSILLLDEPAAGLNDDEADELADLVRRVAHSAGIGVLIVEHKVDLMMAMCDRITVLQNGRLLATGAPADVLGRAEVAAAYLGDSDSDLVSGDRPGAEPSKAASLLGTQPPVSTGASHG